jgi:hypothetical protein
MHLTNAKMRPSFGALNEECPDWDLVNLQDEERPDLASFAMYKILNARTGPSAEYGSGSK